MEILKKIWNVVSTVLVVIVVLCALFLMGSRLMGYSVYTVISGSMEPVYSVGDLLYVKKVDAKEVKVGDPITFVLNEDLVVATHRVTRIDAENDHFYTKGDANEVEDSAPVHFKNLIGVPEFAIPKLGYVSDFIQNPPGMYITIGVGVILILAVFLPDLFGKKKKDEEEEAKAAEARKELDSAAEENEKLKAEVEKLRAEMQKASEEPEKTTVSNPCPDEQDLK